MFAVLARRWRVLVPAVLAAVTLVVTLLPGGAALADPDEGGTPSVRKKLETAARNYNNAKSKLTATTKRRKQLAKDLAEGKRQIATLSDEVGQVAAVKYRGGGTSLVTLALQGRSATEFLAMSDTLTYLGVRDGQKIRALRTARQRQAEQQLALDTAIAQQKKQLGTLKKRRDQAQEAVDAVSGGPGTGYGGGSASATPAPRNPDGSWPSESCSVDDPTTSGCITPRLLHAYQEARKAGYTRFTACYRPQEDGGEHPRGRACDFSVTPDGFGGVASGDAKNYGNNLAAWFIANSDRLAVLYVIWFRQIWLPGVGWQNYNGSGSPSAEHTNHVHLSVQ
ncbi:MAG: hypothetical protein WCA46_30065 [Actinocatenispora sp.]